MHYPSNILQLLTTQHVESPMRKQVSEEHNPELIVMHCSDARVNIAGITDNQLGRYFVRQNIAGVFPEKPDDSLKAFLNYPLFNKPSVQGIMIMGHTKCGGVAALVQSVINDTPPDNSNIEQWVKPLVTPNLVKLIKNASLAGKTPEEIAEQVEQIMPLLSYKHLLNYTLTHEGKEYSLSKLAQEKGICIFPALYHVEQAAGKDPLSGQICLYDFNKHAYVPLTELVQEQLPESHVKKQEGPVFAKGATSETIATLTPKQLDTAIKMKLAEVEFKLTGKMQSKL